MMKAKKMLAKEDEDVWNKETHNLLVKELNRLNEDSENNDIGYNYKFNTKYSLSEKGIGVKEKDLIKNSLSYMLYEQINEKKKELDDKLKEVIIIWKMKQKKKLEKIKGYMNHIIHFK